MPTTWPVAWFFVPVFPPMGLPDRYIVKGERSPSAKDFAARGPIAGLQASLIVHQVDMRASPLFEMLGSTLRVAHRVVSEARGEARLGDFGGVQPDGLPEPAGVTVLEVAVPLREKGEDDLSGAFDEGLALVRAVQRSYSEVTGAVLELATLANLPPMIPVSVGQVSLESVEPPTMGELSIFTLNPLQMAHSGIRADVSDESLHRVGQLLEQLDGSAFGPYAELRREAILHRDLTGNHRMAAAMAGMAGEVLLDTLLTLMWWEERLDPCEAPGFFANTWAMARLQREYHQRLGGNWDTNGQGVVGQYHSKVVQLRHRVVHAGYEPSIHEVGESVETLLELERHIADLLASDRNLSRYTRTSIALSGVDGLQQRGRYTRHVRELAEDPKEPNWSAAYGHWRRHFDLALTGGDVRPGADPNSCHLVCILNKGQPRQWAIHDFGCHRAAQLAHDIARPPTEDLEALAELEAELNRDAHAPQSATVAFEWPAGESITDESWVPDYKLIPELRLF